MSLEIDTSAFDQLADRLDSFSGGGAIDDGLLQASNIYHEAMRQRFRSASNRDGTWEALAERTVKEHRKIGDDPPHTLHFTGDLEKSLSRGQPDHVLELNGNTIVEGTSDPKARFHQDGGGNLPRREILVPPEPVTLEAMKAPLVLAARAAIKGDSEPLNASDEEIAAIFGVELV